MVPFRRYFCFKERLSQSSAQVAGANLVCLPLVQIWSLCYFDSFQGVFSNYLDFLHTLLHAYKGHNP